MSDLGLESAPRPRLSLGPALIVVAIVVVVAGGGVALALSGRHPGTHGPGSTASRPSLTVGAGRARISFSRSAPLGSLKVRAIVPDDVRTALVAPANARLVSTQNHDRGQGPFDRSVVLTSPTAPGALAHAYRVVLRRLGWRINALTPVEEHGAPATQILAEVASVDGYYWQVGVTVGRPRPSATGSAPLASSVTVRLLEVLDAA